MRFQMKQKLFSFGDDFWIEDDEGRPVYFVDGKAFSFGDKLSFQDAHGQELAFIRQKLLSWGPTYEIERDGRLVAVVKKKLFTLMQCRFMIDRPGPDDLEATGDFFDHEYQFFRRDGLVARVSKRWFSWSDSYGVDIAPGEDEVLVLAATVVIDMACHGSNDD
ncbi:MAG: LURP-one-related/scramblase family protein [Phycisphaerales bacterium]